MGDRKLKCIYAFEYIESIVPMVCLKTFFGPRVSALGIAIPGGRDVSDARLTIFTLDTLLGAMGQCIGTNARSWLLSSIDDGFYPIHYICIQRIIFFFTILN